MTAYVTLYDCPVYHARVMAEACERNKRRAAQVRPYAEESGTRGDHARLELGSVGACEGCPGAVALANGAPPHELALEPPDGRDAQRPSAKTLRGALYFQATTRGRSVSPAAERPRRLCPECGGPVEGLPTKVFCTLRCKYASNWRRRKAKARARA